QIQGLEALGPIEAPGRSDQLGGCRQVESVPGLGLAARSKDHGINRIWNDNNLDAWCPPVFNYPFEFTADGEYKIRGCHRATKHPRESRNPCLLETCEVVIQV